MPEKARMTYCEEWKRHKPKTYAAMERKASKMGLGPEWQEHINAARAEILPPRLWDLMVYARDIVMPRSQQYG